LFGVRLVGVNAERRTKLLFSFFPRRRADPARPL